MCVCVCVCVVDLLSLVGRFNLFMFGSFFRTLAVILFQLFIGRSVQNSPVIVQQRRGERKKSGETASVLKQDPNRRLCVTITV